MSYEAMDVAKQILYTGKTYGCNDLSNLKLQKLLYFANITYISITGEPLFDDNVVAEKYGPLVWSVYHNYRHFEKAPIRDMVENTNDALLENIVDFVFEILGLETPTSLVNITHSDPVYDRAKEASNKVMNHTKNEAYDMILGQLDGIIKKAAYASLAGKLCPDTIVKDYEYKDDLGYMSNEERMKFWGIND